MVMVGKGGSAEGTCAGGHKSMIMVIAAGAAVVAGAVEGRERGAGVGLAEASCACFVGAGAVAVVISVVGTGAIAASTAGDLIQSVGVVVCGGGWIGVGWEGSSSEAGLFVIGAAVVRGIAVMLVLFVMMEGCCAEGCTTGACCKFASTVVLVEAIWFVDEGFLARYRAVGQAGARVRRTSPRCGWYRYEWILVVAIIRECWMLGHVWHATSFVSVFLMIISTNEAISRLWSILMALPAFDLIAIWWQ
jgi:hypothetical protein